MIFGTFSPEPFSQLAWQRGDVNISKMQYARLAEFEVPPIVGAKCILSATKH